LIYDEIAHRLRCCKDFPPGVLAEASGMVRRFLQDHHEKLEEELLFPRFEQSGQHVALVTILRQQHAAGRQLLDLISGLATPETAKNMIEGARLTVYLNLFTRLYRPHTAREDTVLFPALRTIVTPREFNSLSKQFQDQQTRLGPDGYEKLNTEISDLEKSLNLHDLPQFTPKL
jgi:hemerythrin-like domain-containing protein